MEEITMKEFEIKNKIARAIAERQMTVKGINDATDTIYKILQEQLTIPVVGWRSEQLPTYDIDDINEIIEECKDNKDSLETLISRIWNRGLITGVNK